MRHRPVPDLGERAPEAKIALRETVVLWLYGAIVLVAGRIIGFHYFGEAIALHLNGSLVGATRVQAPIEVFTWGFQYQMSREGTIVREMVDLVGIEPTTSSMPWKRAPSCATGPISKTLLCWRGTFIILAEVAGIVNARKAFTTKGTKYHEGKKLVGFKTHIFPQLSSVIIDRAPHLHKSSKTT